MEMEETEYNTNDIVTNEGHTPVHPCNVAGTDAAARIRALDRLTATNLRKHQVINKVSDIVRELVENSLDAEATTIQVYLEKFGKDKIEVRDNGHGFIPSEVQPIFQGGCTSKLLDTSNLTRGQFLGFKGEALNAMCAVGNVTVISKTKETVATKYKLDLQGRVVSESKVAHGIGTTITVEKLFEGIRVRRQRLDNTVAASSELKEIEAFLKGAGIAYPKCHISCYHDTQSVWSKPSVQTSEQALVTVLGHNIAKRLRKCGPILVDGDCNMDLREESRPVRSVELYLPIKPVDMRTMSYTSNKMTMIFCNRKRVYFRELEKMMHRYITACVEKPQPSDQRRHPVSVVCIQVPPNEADFNLDMDKSKVFLIFKDKILSIIEDSLVKFYEIDLRNSSENAQQEDIILSGVQNSVPSSSSNLEGLSAIVHDVTKINDKTNVYNKNHSTVVNKSCVTETSQVIDSNVFVPILNTSTSPSSRESTISEFLLNIPSMSTSFTQSPLKSVNSGPVTVSFPASKVNVDVPEKINSIKSIQIPNISKISGGIAVANFEISIGSQDSEIDFDTSNSKSHTEVLSDVESYIPAENPKQSETKSDTSNEYENWLHGRIVDKHGDIIENVLPVTEIPSNNNNHQDHDERVRTALFGSSGRTTSHEKTRSEQQSSFSTSSSEPPHKRRKNTHATTSDSSTFLSPGISCFTPRMPTHRQITLDSLNNWQTPTGVFSQAASKAVVGVRIPITPDRLKRTSELEVQASCHVKDQNQNAPSKSLNLWEHEQRPNYRQQSLLTSQIMSVKKPPTSGHQMHSGGKLTPRIHREIQEGSGTGGQFYIAQTYDSIGVFSPYDMIKYFPRESRECWLTTADNSYESPTSLSLEKVSEMFHQFLTRSDIHTTLAAKKIFHILSKLPNLTEIIAFT